MHDPLEHGRDDASQHGGPFVESRGLLGGILRRGQGGVQQQPSHTPAATPTPNSPDVRQLTRRAKQRARDASRGDGDGTTFPWYLRNIRLVVFAVVLLYAGISNVFSAADRSVDAARPADTPRAFPVQTQGRYDVEVLKVGEDRVTLRHANGKLYYWKVTKPAVKAVLQRHVGTTVVVYWRVEDGITHAVGVAGPKGTVPPDSDAERSNSQLPV